MTSLHIVHAGIWAWMVVASAISLPAYLNPRANMADFPFRNTSLSWAERTWDLVSRLSLEDLVGEMAMTQHGRMADMSPPVSSLNVSAFAWNNECQRGAVRAGLATGFPQVLGTAASFDLELNRRIGEATAVEARAKYYDALRRGNYGNHMGVACYGPTANLMRDPRWGRNQETYGEDPWLVGEMTGAFVRGLQGNDTRYIRATADCKQYAAYAGPENIPTDRHVFNAVVSERDFRTTFLPGFRGCVLAGAFSVMCSYNSVNGVPACVNSRLLTEVLRDEWNFTGFVVSDNGALEGVVNDHHYAKDFVSAAAMAVQAGVNQELSGKAQKVFAQLGEAVSRGLLTEDKLRQMVTPLIYTRMRLGEFDPPEMNPYSTIPMSVVQGNAHQMLALEATLKSFVLLKNNGILPMKNPNYTMVAVVGLMANSLDQLYGDYSPDIDPRYATTPLWGLMALGENVRYDPACSDVNCTDYKNPGGTVSWANLTVVCLGTGIQVESEAKDRADIALPGKQLQMLKDAVKHSAGPVIVLVFSASPVNLQWADSQPKVAAILHCFLPGQAAGEAVRSVLLGQGPWSVPSARLPFTWYADHKQLPPMTNYSMEGRTYRYFQGTPLYPFGYGLSYTRFRYSGLQVAPSLQAGQNLSLSLSLSNLGSLDAEEAVQVYVRWDAPSVPTPQLQLVGVAKVWVASQASTPLSLSVPPSSLAVWTDSRGWVVEPGAMTLYVGGQQPGQARVVGSNVMSASFSIHGTAVLGFY